jgi:hypothetical protein
MGVSRPPVRRGRGAAEQRPGAGASRVE